MNTRPTLVAELIAEFLGTFVLILLGTGVVAMVVLLFHRADGGSFRCGGAGVSKLPAGFQASGSATGKNGGRVHNFSRVPRIAAGRVFGLGDRHSLAASTDTRHHR